MTNNQEDKALFWGCWIALVTTSFGFIARIFTQGAWGAELNLSATQQGEILGAGLWPFGISIILFSLVMDKIGYKTAMAMGFACHVVSIILTLTAKSYNSFYLATFIMALGNGTVEAYINPVVATVFNKDKSKWLNYLHGGWSGGFVIAGLIMIIAIPDAGWRTKIGLTLIPAVIYFAMLIGKKFPIGESAAAGVPLKETLGEVGGIGVFFLSSLIAAQVMQSLSLVDVSADQYATLKYGAVVGLIVAIATSIYTKSFLGRPMFLILLFTMSIPMSITELGVDSWITALMEPTLGANAKWLFVITALAMTIMRFSSGPVLHKLTPLGALALASAGAAIALFVLSSATGAAVIFLCGMLYGVAKAFFWPTTLGVVSEQFPRGGAMTLNGINGGALLGVGIIGTILLGGIVDKTVDNSLMAANPAVHAKVTVDKSGLLGSYKAVDQVKYEALPAAEKKVVDDVKAGSTKTALASASRFPIIMLVVYLGLFFYFKSKGGYKPVDVNAASAH
jgi:MFS family permease